MDKYFQLSWYSAKSELNIHTKNIRSSTQNAPEHIYAFLYFSLSPTTSGKDLFMTS